MLSASVVVQVDVTDKNDNPMTFNQPYYNHTVPETASIGTVIFAVTASDIDEGNKCDNITHCYGYLMLKYLKTNYMKLGIINRNFSTILAIEISLFL